MMKPNSQCPKACPLCGLEFRWHGWTALACHVWIYHSGTEDPYVNDCPCGYSVKEDNGVDVLRSLAVHLSGQKDVVEHLTLAAIANVGGT